MRGRGIGTARGRATIMRGVFVFNSLRIEIDDPFSSFLIANGSSLAVIIFI